MELPKPIQSRHSLRGRSVPPAVDDDRHVGDAAMAMETGSDAEDRGFPTHGQGFGQWAIERDLEPGSLDWVEAPSVSAHAANTTRFQGLAIFPGSEG